RDNSACAQLCAKTEGFVGGHDDRHAVHCLDQIHRSLPRDEILIVFRRHQAGECQRRATAALCPLPSALCPLPTALCQLPSAHCVASPPSTMTFSTTPPPARLNDAACWYSGDSKQATPCSSVGNSITTNRWKSCGPSLILYRPPRARILPPCLAMIAGTRSVYFLY